MSENKKEAFKFKTSTLKVLHETFDEFLNLIYPKKCLVCGKVFSHERSFPTCERCFLEFKLVNYNITGDFNFDRNLSIFEYNETLRAIILDIKFGKKAYKMVNLAKLAVKANKDNDFFLSDYKDFDAVIPVPLHKKRFRVRGFNQSYVLAKEIAQAINLPLDTDICERNIYREPQSSLKSGKYRQGNVLSVFSLKKDSIITGKNFVLVDDIFTTGSTLDSLAKVLRDNGADKIACITVGIASARPLEAYAKKPK